MRLHVPYIVGNFKSWARWVAFSEDKLITQYSWYACCFLASAVQGLQIAPLACPRLPSSPMYFLQTLACGSCQNFNSSFLISSPKWWCKILNTKLTSFWITNCLDPVWPWQDVKMLPLCAYNYVPVRRLHFS